MAVGEPITMLNARLILASASPSRSALLRSAGMTFEVRPADIDESAIRASLEAEGSDMPPPDIAEILARAKAETVSELYPGACVIGADQILVFEDRIFEKPLNFDAARETLLRLQGETHHLHASVCVARAGATCWAQTETARLTMRPLTPEVIGRYLAEAGETVLTSVGAYKLESYGVHLFAQVRGDYFTILGLPLLPLLAFLRAQDALRS